MKLSKKNQFILKINVLSSVSKKLLACNIKNINPMITSKTKLDSSFTYKEQRRPVSGVYELK